MYIDVKLDDYTGDIDVSTGDLQLTTEIRTLYSVRQEVLLCLRWINGEWRLGPEIGFPWFDDVFVKNPNIEKIRNEIRNTIMSIDGVADAKVTTVDYSPKHRTAKFGCEVAVGEEVFYEEVGLNG